MQPVTPTEDTTLPRPVVAECSIATEPFRLGLQLAGPS